MCMCVLCVCVCIVCMCMRVTMTCLPSEHDRCVLDVQELKWHVSYDTRQLARFQSNLDAIGKHFQGSTIM